MYMSGRMIGESEFAFVFQCPDQRARERLRNRPHRVHCLEACRSVGFNFLQTETLRINNLPIRDNCHRRRRCVVALNQPVDVICCLVPVDSFSLPRGINLRDVTTFSDRGSRASGNKNAKCGCIHGVNTFYHGGFPCFPDTKFSNYEAAFCDCGQACRI